MVNLVIFKYPLEVKDEQEIDMPLYAQLLDVQTQDNSPVLWALVDPKAPKVKRKFRLYGTGHLLPETVLDEEYVGTYQIRANAVFVGHVFEVKEKVVPTGLGGA